MCSEHLPFQNVPFSKVYYKLDFSISMLLIRGSIKNTMNMSMSHIVLIKVTTHTLDCAPTFILLCGVFINFFENVILTDFKSSIFCHHGTLLSVNMTS